MRSHVFMKKTRVNIRIKPTQNNENITNGKKALNTLPKPLAARFHANQTPQLTVIALKIDAKSKESKVYERVIRPNNIADDERTPCLIA